MPVARWHKEARPAKFRRCGNHCHEVGIGFSDGVAEECYCALTSAIGGKADIRFALQMSAYDPKRTLASQSAKL